MYRYFPAVRTAINVRDSGAINSPGNALTLIAPLHDQFGSFEMAFEQVEVSVACNLAYGLRSNLTDVRGERIRIR